MSTGHPGTWPSRSRSTAALLCNHGLGDHWFWLCLCLPLSPRESSSSGRPCASEEGCVRGGAWSAFGCRDVLVASDHKLAKQGFGRPSLPALFESDCLLPTRSHPQGGPLQTPVSHLQSEGLAGSGAVSVAQRSWSPRPTSPRWVGTRVNHWLLEMAGGGQGGTVGSCGRESTACVLWGGDLGGPSLLT